MDIEVHEVSEAGGFPNAPGRPVLVYRGAVPSSADAIQQAFAQHGWTNGWQNGVYSVHHYHSTAHEVLGCYKGSARLQLGGPSGVIIAVRAGDVILVPAGVAHKNLESSADFAVYGAYADGRDYDMNYGKPDERPAADRRIAEIPRPACDPVAGPKGPLHQHWT